MSTDDEGLMSMDDDEMCYVDDSDEEDNNNDNNTQQQQIKEQPELQRASEQAATSTIANDEAIKARERAMRNNNGGLVFQTTTVSAATNNSTTMASAMAVSGPDVVADSVIVGGASPPTKEQLTDAQIKAQIRASRDGTRRVSGIRPGAYSQPAAAASPTQAQLTDADIKAQVRASRSTAGTPRAGSIRPGAYSESGQTVEAAARVEALRDGHTRASGASIDTQPKTQAQLDAISKSRARRAGRKMPTIRQAEPARQLSSEQDTGLGAVTTASINQPLSREEMDRQAKMRAKHGRAPSGTATAVPTTMARPSLAEPATVEPVTTSSIRSMSQEDSDRQSKMRAKNGPGVSVGAVPVGPMTTPASPKAGSTTPRMHARSKRHENDGNVTSVTRVNSVTSDQAVTLEERVRRKVAEGSSLGRSSRHRDNHAEPQSGAVHATGTSPQKPHMTMQEQQNRRLQDKLAHMDPSSNNKADHSLKKGDDAIQETMSYYDKVNVVNVNDTNKVMDSTASHQQPAPSSQDVLAQRLNSKLAQMERQEIDQENARRAINGEGPLEEADPAKDMKSSELGFDTMGMANHNSFSHFAQGATTTADRGIAAAPEVEYGEMEAPMLANDDLAVAIAIDEDEEERKFIPAAVEYDPDAKPPLYKNRRVRLYTIGAILMCIIVIVLIVVAFVIIPDDNKGTPGASGLVIEDTTVPPTNAPTTQKEGIYRSFFARKVGNRVYEEGSPHDLAAMWMIEEDPMALDVNDANFFQRYMLAFLYFSTSTKQKWRTCNKPEEGEDENCVFEDLVRNEDDSVSYEPIEGMKRWLSGTFECEWVGVNCGPNPRSRTVYGIEFFGQNMTGSLPSELTALPTLQSLTLSYSFLTGSIPTEYASMPYLARLELHGNMLTGTIPEEIYASDGSMVVLNVADNLLTGTLSTNIGKLSSLKGLHIYSNNLGGDFPTEIGNLRSLAFMRLGDNEFVGKIPTELGGLTQLNELWINRSRFTGSIPSELGKLRRLMDLRVAQNKRITGSIPDEIWDLSRLEYLFLDDNELIGSLSPDVQKLVRLKSLKVSRNQLTGEIPSEMGTMSTLHLAWLHLNDMVGSMPSEICDAQDKWNKMDFLQTDCEPPANPTIPCDCCLACCDRETALCYYADGQELD